jgi:DNA-binding transcriptional LysR family regulator
MKTTLDELLAFKTVVDTGSISAAAEQLGQTSSGISRALSRLEQKLNTTLMRRTTRRLELSEEGQLFLARAREILQSVEAAEDELACRHLKPAGKLRVNAASPFILHVLVPLVNDFLAEYPDIELELHSGDSIIDLIEHRADVAVRIGTLRDSTLHAKPLTAYRMRLYASPAYLKKAGRPTKVDDLARHSLLGFTQPEILNTWPLRHPDGDGLAITPTIAASSGETVRQLALAGAGIACLSDFMTGPDRARGDLVQVLMRDTLEVRQQVHAVYYRNTELASRIRCFVDFLALRLASPP